MYRMHIYIVSYVCIVYTQNYNIDRTGFMKSWYYNVQGYSESDNYEIGNLLLLNISKHPLVPQLLCLMSCLLASSTCSRGTGEEPMEKHPASPDELIEVKFKDHTFPIFCLHPSQNWICLTESLWDQKLIVLAVFLFSPGTLSSWSSSPRFCPQLRSSRRFP